MKTEAAPQKELYECTCPCHDPDRGEKITHTGYCCHVAPCGMNVQKGASDLHLENCTTCQEMAQEAGR